MRITPVVERLLTKLALVVVVAFQIFLAFLSIVAFHKPETVGMVMARSLSGIFQIGYLIVSSAAPLLISIILVRLTSHARRYSFHLLAFIVTLYCAVSSILLCYRMETGLPFDWSLLRYHLADSLETMVILSRPYERVIFLSIAAFLLYYYGLLFLYQKNKRSSLPGEINALHPARVLLGIYLFVFLVIHFSADNGLSNLIIESRQARSEAKKIYAYYYADSIERIRNRQTFTANANLNQNLFFIHLESINADLVDAVITPRFVELAKNRGVFFPRIQAPSIFTVLSQETILCSVLPSLERNLAESEEVRHSLVCLPQILKQFGFRTLHFHALSNIHFANTDVFMKAAGFDEWHASDIMKPGDMKLQWGYGDEIFYQRVFEYLQRFKGQKIFVYMQVNGINHYPFYDDEKKAAFPKLTDSLPFTAPNSLKERLGDTMYIQDYFFGKMYETYFGPQYARNSNMLVFGDHSWPAGMHPGNTININQAFQENFVTSLGILPALNRRAGNEGISRGREVRSLHSYLDIMPTVLEMYGIRPNKYYGGSFFSELTDGVPDAGHKRCVVSVQPFSGGYIAIVNYPVKHLFDLKKGIVTVYNLAQDPNETNPVQQESIQQANLEVLDTCLRSLKQKFENRIS